MTFQNVARALSRDVTKFGMTADMYFTSELDPEVGHIPRQRTQAYDQL